MSAELQLQLTRKQREIDLLRQLDELRDQINEGDSPNVMYLRLLKLIMAEFKAHGGALYVLDTHGEGESILTMGMSETSGKTLCEQVLSQNSISEIYTPDAPEWTYSVGVKIALKAEQPLGVLILTRNASVQDFSPLEQELLLLAESQMDSAIIQAQRIWRLALRNRELDTIFRLDRLRDEKPEENELINGFVQVIMEQYSAELCIVMLSHPDSGEIAIRSMIDRLGLKPPDYQQLVADASQINTLTDLASPKSGAFVIAMPFIINGMRLGGVIIGRKAAFSVDDRRLLVAMTSQIDSAIVYSRVIKQLSQRTKELEIIYQIDHIRDSEKDFDAMLQAVLGELCRAVDAQMGYILLFSDDEEDHLELKSAVEDGIIISTDYYEAIHDISRKALTSAAMVYENQRGGDVRSIVAVPLILHNRVIGVFGGVNSLSINGFSAEDRRMLSAIASQADTAVFERLEQRRVRQVLGRSVDPKVLEHLLQHSNNSDILAGERMNISVLFADLRGSTEWAERTEPDRLAYTLNAYLGRMTEVIFEHGGTLDKFVGDEVIGLFGAPLAMPDHAERCAAAALKMQSVMHELIQEMHARGYELPPMGVGVSSGEAICGEFGAPNRTDYTAMGRVMNLGARLCGAAQAGEVVISENTYQILQARVQAEPLNEVTLKGIGKSQAYKLIHIEANF